jgi:hypothetical protein
MSPRCRAKLRHPAVVALAAVLGVHVACVELAKHGVVKVDEVGRVRLA